MDWTAYVHKGMTRNLQAQTKLPWSIPIASLTHWLLFSFRNHIPFPLFLFGEEVNQRKVEMDVMATAFFLVTLRPNKMSVYLG